MAYVGGQETAVNPRRAGWYAGAFTLGLFITIAVVGIVCAPLGRMLGDVGVWWQVLVGAVLIWVALGMLGVQACSMSGTLLYRLKLRDIHGAFGLGLAYGILSGSCTFGFIAPILAIVTVQQKIVAGSVMMILFALGHCLPIVAAGSSTALVRNSRKQRLAGGRLVVSERRRRGHRSAGRLFYRRPVRRAGHNLSERRYVSGKNETNRMAAAAAGRYGVCRSVSRPTTCA